MIEKIIQSLMVIAFIAILIFVNRGAWAIGELMSAGYLFGFGSGVMVVVAWWRFTVWLDER